MKSKPKKKGKGVKPMMGKMMPNDEHMMKKGMKKK